MYDQLHEIWKTEMGNLDLTVVPTDFYGWVASYIKKLREETRMLDKRALKASLLNKEIVNVRRLVREIVKARHKKIVRHLTKGDSIALELLTFEEQQIYKSACSFSEGFRELAQSVFRGQPPKVAIKNTQGRMVLRFLKEVPAIIGSDMKAYGPFKPEDIASLPIKNGRAFIKQGVAEEVEAGRF